MSENLDDLRNVAVLAGRAVDVDHTLGTALDALADVIPYDLAAVLELRDEILIVRCARGPLADEQVRNHRLALSAAPELAAAIASGRPRVFTEEDHDRTRGGDGDPYDGVVDLPYGHACLVAPLVAGGRTVGVMTFDRSVCDRYDDGTVALVTVYAQLVALSLALSIGHEVTAPPPVAAETKPVEPPSEPVTVLSEPPRPETRTLLEVEREAISAALIAQNWRIYGPEGAAAKLGLPPSTLQHRMRKLGLVKPR
jgi:transcriptional regulator with GAF, ATPase, and Fis domain